MGKQIKCILTAAIAVILVIVTMDVTYSLQQNKVTPKTASTVSVSQSDVKKYIYKNYSISEKNPWTDNSLKSIEYKNFEGKIVPTLSTSISAKAAILVNMDSNEVIYNKNADTKMYPASTTKLMTALTVLQNMNTSDEVTIGNEVNMIASDSSRAGFIQGQTVTVEELLEGLLISSGNDAAYILAKACGEVILEDDIANENKKFTTSQYIERFVYEMNKNVKDMDLKNTNFTSPDGYDNKSQFTSASDLSKIAIRAYENETIANICSTPSLNSKTLNKTWTSTNQLIDKGGKYYYEYCKGLKTGSTDLAGKCLVSIAKKDNQKYVSVVLQASSDESRFGDSKTLLEYGVEGK